LLSLFRVFQFSKLTQKITWTKPTATGSSTDKIFFFSAETPESDRPAIKDKQPNAFAHNNTAEKGETASTGVAEISHTNLQSLSQPGRYEYCFVKLPFDVRCRVPFIVKPLG
jgi:hypothetical protein